MGNPTGRMMPKAERMPPDVHSPHNQQNENRGGGQMPGPMGNFDNQGHAEGANPGWPEAQGPSYREVLGQPNPSNPLPPVWGAIGSQLYSLSVFQ